MGNASTRQGYTATRLERALRFYAHDIKAATMNWQTYFNDNRHVGQLDATKENVASAMIGAPQVGEVVRLQFQCDRQQIIQQVKFKAYGGRYLIASMAYLAELMTGMPLKDLNNIKTDAIVDALQLPEKNTNAAIYALTALKAAISNFEEKQNL